MPRIAPFRKTFSRPVSSGWKPVPTSSRLPTRPRIAARALGGSRDARQDLEQRRLPGAVAPDDPERLAFLEVERDVAERPDLLVAAPMLLPREPLADVGHRLAERPVRGLELADPVALGEARRRRSRRTSDGVRELRLGGAEDRRGRRRTRRGRRATPTAVCPRSGVLASSIAQLQPAITAVIGLNARIHCHFVGISSTAYMTPERSGSTWRKTGIM